MKRHILVLILLSVFFNACASNRVHTLRRAPAENGHNQAVVQSIKETDAGKCWGLGCEQYNEFPVVVEYQRTNIQSTISIPLKKKDHIEQIPANLPQILKDSLRFDVCRTGVKGIGCKLSDKGNSVDISLNYQKSDAHTTGCAAVITDALGAFLFIPVLMAPFHLALCLSPKDIEPQFEQPRALISFPPYKGYGVSFDYRISPSPIYLSCDSKECTVIDKNGKAINEINIEKNYSIDKQKIKDFL
ncbi:MAG: hypothetical protein J6J74_01850 [Elusimicrobiaceae bacterium]|nr:hypothetical protein [Elusimicrobiaceae bacterium]